MLQPPLNVYLCSSLVCSSPVCSRPFVFGQESTVKAGNYLFGVKLHFCQGASLNFWSCPVFSWIFQEMLAACWNIKYKGCNIRVLSTHISSGSDEVLMVALPFLTSTYSVEKCSWAPLLVFSCVYLEGFNKVGFPVAGKWRGGKRTSSLAFILPLLSNSVSPLCFYCYHLTSYSFSCPYA